MGGKNYRSGAGFEYRYLQNKLKTGLRGGRFFRSTGPFWRNIEEKEYAPVDVYWIDNKKCYHEAQCKYSRSKIGCISEEEMLRLLEYAMQFDGKIIVHLASKKGGERTIHDWVIKNSYID